MSKTEDLSIKPYMFEPVWAIWKRRQWTCRTSSYGCSGM